MGTKSILGGHAAAAGAYVIFGLNIVLCKDIAGASVVDPLSLFSMRAAGATLLFFLVSLFMPREKVERKDFPKVALASVLGLFLPQFTFLKAITVSTAIDTAIVSTLAPVFTMIFATIFLKEPLTLKKALGVALSLSGVIFLIFNSFHLSGDVKETSLEGYALLLLNCVSFASYLGVFRPLIVKYNVVTFMKWMFFISLLVSLPFSISGLLKTDYSSFTPVVIAEIAYVVVFATFVAYFLIPIGQKRIRPTIVSMYTYFQPIIATVVSISSGMDRITWQKVLATVFVFWGVWTVNKSKAASQQNPGESLQIK